MVLLALVLAAALALPVTAAPRCFAETSQCLDGRIREYWEANGSLPVFGYPVTAQAPEASRDTGQLYATQWMERNRFELHPENAAPYDVLLGRLGDDRLRQLGVDWFTLPKAGAGAAHYFAASGHAIAHEPFWSYWSTHGLDLGDPGTTERESLALFGLPISEPRIETNASGASVLTQWFERARFEDHGASGVLLGLLGNELRAGAPVPPAPAPSAPPAPSTPPTPVPPAPSPVPPAPPAPTAVPTPAPPQNRCDPSYPDVCIPPPPPDLDCGEIQYRRFRVLQPDPHRFDGDNDGIGCES